MSYLLDVKPTTIADLFYLNSVHEKVRARAEYIGLVIKQFLMFRMPKTRDKRNLLSLNPGISINVRLVTNSINMDYVTFKATVQSILTFKEKILVLDFPHDNTVKLNKIRTQPRIPVELMGEVKVESGPELISLLTDFSLSGCKCECLPADPNFSGDFDVIAEEIVENNASLSFRLDTLDEQDVTLHAEIKNVNPREKLHIGLKFKEQDKVSPIYSKLLMVYQGLDQDSD